MPSDTPSGVALINKAARTDAELSAQLRASQTPADIAAVLGLPLGLLNSLAYSRRRPAYRIFHVPKANGGTREIMAPHPRLKEAQRLLGRALNAAYQPPSTVHGFTAGRSALTNARAHVGNRWVFNIDLENFFPSISFGRVRAMLRTRPYAMGDEAAQLIASLCCHDGVLAQGAPTSPILANMVTAMMDTHLRNYAAANRCRYTRYADDLTFSTPIRRFPAALAERRADGTLTVHPDLATIIARYGFTVNPGKTRLAFHSEQQQVTGLVVNNRPNLPRTTIRQIRGMMHAWLRHGDAAEATFTSEFDAKRRSERPGLFREVLTGKLSYLAMVKGKADPVHVNLVQRGRRRYDDENSTTAFYDISIPEDGVVILEGNDITEGATQGTGFFLEGVGLVTCAHICAPDLHAFRWHHPLTAHRTVQRISDSNWDVAIHSTTLPSRFAFRVGSTVGLQIGSRVRVLGFPNWAPGRPMSVTDALIHGELASSFGARRFSITSAIFGGNSGGPVINHGGEVVGVALKGMFQNGGGSENMFIPIDYVLDLHRRLPVARTLGASGAGFEAA